MIQSLKLTIEAMNCVLLNGLIDYGVQQIWKKKID